MCEDFNTSSQKFFVKMRRFEENSMHSLVSHFFDLLIFNVSSIMVIYPTVKIYSFYEINWLLEIQTSSKDPLCTMTRELISGSVFRMRPYLAASG